MGWFFNPFTGKFDYFRSVIPATDVEVSELGTATYDDVQDYINFFGDRTILDGGGITATSPVDGTVIIAACKAWCKETDSDTAIGKFFDYAGATGVALTDLTANIIYLDYNGGTPQIVVATSPATHGFKQDHILMGAVYRYGNETHIVQSDLLGIQGINRNHMHLVEHAGPHRSSGMVTSSTGTRNLAVTAGVLYLGLTRRVSSSFDTSGTDTFSYWYYDGDAGPAVWVEVTGATQISRTQYNALATGLASLITNRYGVHWVYLDIHGEHLHIVYGQGNYTASQAELAAVPASLPPIATTFCVLIAKIICQEGTDVLTITYPWTTVFTSSLATDHGSLAGLTDDDHALYIKDSEFTAADEVMVGTGSGTFGQVTLAASQFLAKKAAGAATNITAAEAWVILSGQAGAAVSMNDKTLTALAGMLATAETELTIAAGVITVTQMRHKVDTAGDAASDDLDTINGGTTVNLIILRAENDARTVVVKHGTGNIWLQGKADISLDDLEDGIMLAWDSTNSKWFDIAAGGAVVAAHAILDGTVHNDSVADAVTRGSLIYGNATPKWDELGLGAAGTVPTSDGTDLAFGHGAALQDADGDTKIQVEEGADEDKIRMDVAGVEAFQLDAVGILTLAKQSGAMARITAAEQPCADTELSYAYLDEEVFDNQNEWDTTNGSGTAEVGTAGTTLHDDGAFVGAVAGMYVHNTTDETYAIIASVTSDDEVELDESIFAVGETFLWYASKFTASVAGKYLLVGCIYWDVTTATKTFDARVHKNDFVLTFQRMNTSLTGAAGDLGEFCAIVVDLAANDYISLMGYQQAGVTQKMKKTLTSLSCWRIG